MMDQDKSQGWSTHLELSETLMAKLQPRLSDLRESTTYQKILRDGRTEGLPEGRTTEARRILLRQGTKRFGTPDTVALAALEAIHDIDRLEDLGDRLLDADVRDWNGLLGLA